jgi:hypothetical protein
MNNNIDTLTNKTVSWIDTIINLGSKYSSLLVWGVLAMMVAKMAKFNVKMGGK